MYRITEVGVEGRTAIDLLKEVYADRVIFELDENGVETIKSIDGFISDDMHNWALYVNDMPYDGDANTYVTTDGEIIEWVLVERTPIQ
jgi:hypothetical protein